MIRILIVDDQNFTRQALQAILEIETDFAVVGKAKDGVSAIEYIEKVNPDILMVDLEMPKMNGLTLTRKVRQLYPHIRVIILSSNDDESSIDAAVKAGVRGYLLKSTSAQEIVDTVRYVQRGYFQLGPGLFEKMLSHILVERDQTSDYVSQLEKKYSSYLARLEKKIVVQNEAKQREIYATVDSQIENLKLELREGLEAFQGKVGHQLKTGLEAINSRYQGSSHQELEQQIKDLTFEQQRYINTFLLGTKQSIKKLEQQVRFLRYFIIFLSMTFFVEKLVLLLF